MQNRQTAAQYSTYYISYVSLKIYKQNRSHTVFLPIMAHLPFALLRCYTLHLSPINRVLMVTVTCDIYRNAFNLQIVLYRWTPPTKDHAITYWNTDSQSLLWCDVQFEFCCTEGNADINVIQYAIQMTQTCLHNSYLKRH